MLAPLPPPADCCASKIRNQLGCKSFGICSLRSSREEIDGVLHRIRGQNPAVVAVLEAALEVALQPHLYVPLVNRMTLACTLHPHHAHARFSVPILSQRDHRASASSIGRIAMGSEQQGNMIMLVRPPNLKGDLHKWMEWLDPLAPKIRCRLKMQPISPAFQRLILAQHGFHASIGIRSAFRHFAPMAVSLSRQTNHHPRRRFSPSQIQHMR